MKFEDYLERELESTHEFEDESIISDLYLVSLPMSLRELKVRSDRIEEEGNEDRKKRMQKEYDEDLEKQGWLLRDCEEICRVKTISLDQLKNRVDDKKKSCDAYFYNPNTRGSKRNLMIEFKNVNKDKMLEYIKKDDKDGVLSKVVDSVELLKGELEFEGYDPEQIVSNTHLMLVYGEKANTVSAMHLNLGSKGIVNRDRNGRQSRAVRMDRQKSKEYSVKETKEILDKFSDKMKSKGFASCPEGYFGVPIKEPDSDKSGKEKCCWFTLYSKKDFQRVVKDQKFFENWDWGVYGKYFG